MESLIGYGGYGSDDDSEEITTVRKQTLSQTDVNYEEVHMDLSEESNSSTKLDNRHQSSNTYSKYQDKDYYKKSSDRYKHERDRNSPKYQDNKKDERCKEREGRTDEDRYRRDDKERDKERESRTDEDRYRRDDKERDRDYKRDKYRDDRSRPKDERRRSRDRVSERTYDSRDNGRDERRSYRHSSRDRRRSRSPRKSDYRSRRSGSRDRVHSKRYDSSSKMERLGKLGINFNVSNNIHMSTDAQQQQEKDRFFMPGITGRFTEQIQRRKLLWQKKNAISGEEPAPAPAPAPANVANSGINLQSNKIWQNTTFAQDTDGKVANKFKRLMGIRGEETKTARTGTDTLKKQEEMFNSMEAQYEVARTATHTMRGVGLGFGNFQR